MTLLRDLPLFGFGLICSSCSPGGSGSNVWCLLLGGDVSLSLTMTFFSITASLCEFIFIIVYTTLMHDKRIDLKTSSND